MFTKSQLDSDCSCDVVVIGAGITGALIADELACYDHDVVVLDQRDMCWGSTSASTALLQYEIDSHATEIAKGYGEDEHHDIPARRAVLVDRKAATLQLKAARLFPQLQAKPAFAWAGTFAETKDGLPLFGQHPQYGPRVLFALAYGGNGITYSMLGAGLLRAQIERRPHALTELFAFARLEKGS